MYWIEVDFDNGKTLTKESKDLNDTFKVYSRYKDNHNKKVKVLAIRAGKQ